MLRTLGVTIGAALLAAAAPAEDGLKKLSWLGGTWVSEEGGRWTEEHWSDARGGVMMGTNRSGAGASFAGYEFMRITGESDGSVRYWAHVPGQAPVPFTLVSSADGEAVFENPAHDYPTRVTYRSEGKDALVATISGPNGAKARSWRFVRGAGR